MLAAGYVPDLQPGRGLKLTAPRGNLQSSTRAQDAGLAQQIDRMLADTDWKEVGLEGELVPWRSENNIGAFPARRNSRFPPASAGASSFAGGGSGKPR